jgi:DNA-binding CsgD family transcriptional regulator
MDSTPAARLAEFHRTQPYEGFQRPAPAGPALTPREGEVMQWLTSGKRDRDIAEILGISPRTVHKHLQRIYEKLGVETRTAAVMRALHMRG